MLHKPAALMLAAAAALMLTLLPASAGGRQHAKSGAHPACKCAPRAKVRVIYGVAPPVYLVDQGPTYGAPLTGYAAPGGVYPTVDPYVTEPAIYYGGDYGYPGLGFYRRPHHAHGRWPHHRFRAHARFPQHRKAPHRRVHAGPRVRRGPAMRHRPAVHRVAPRPRGGRAR